MKKSLITIGAGIISLKLIRNFLIAACSDGNIYVFDTKTVGSTAITSITGPGNMLLSMDLWENKVKHELNFLFELFYLIFFASFLRLLPLQKMEV